MKFTPYLILSAERADLDPATNQRRTETLRHQLAPYSPIALTGRYEGSPEQSFMVPAPDGSETADAVERLAWNWEQDSVLYVDQSKLAYLVLRDGSRRELGPLREVDPSIELPSYLDLPDGRRLAA